MIVATILNLFKDKKTKAIKPLEVWGYEEEEEPKPISPEMKKIAGNLQMRLFMAHQKHAVSSAGHSGGARRGK